MSDHRTERPLAKTPACPICGRAIIEKFSPFCSRRCADVDLGRWFNERYVVPVKPEEDDEGLDEADES